VAFDVLELAQPYFTHQPTDLAIRKRTSDMTKATIYWHVFKSAQNSKPAICGTMEQKFWSVTVTLRLTIFERVLVPFQPKMEPVPEWQRRSSTSLNQTCRKGNLS